MKKNGEAFVGIDTAKARNAVAIAEGGRKGEIRYLGEIDATPDAVAKLVRKLAGRYETLQFCYEAGPTGYGLYRQILSLGHSCVVAAPAFSFPRRPGDRVKTNRRDAQSLARLLRAGELSAVWVGFLTATALVAEAGDIRRFDHPRQLMAFLGLVPSERSTGETRRQGGITRAGNVRARKALVEAAWTYRHPAGVGDKHQKRQTLLPQQIRDIAW